MIIQDCDHHLHNYTSLTDLLQHAMQRKSGIFIAFQRTTERISHDLGKKYKDILVKADQGKETSLKN